VPHIRGWAGGRGMRRVESEGRLVNEAIRHRHTQWDRQMATVALSILQAMQMYYGTELDPKVPY